MLEGPIQSKVVSWARHDLGVLASKLGTVAWRDDPDYAFWVPGGRPLLIEFKATGKKASDKQLLRHQELRDAGYEVEVHDSIEGAKLCILRHCAAAWFQLGVGNPFLLVTEYRRLGFTWDKVDGIALGNVRGAAEVGDGALHGGGKKVAGKTSTRRRVARSGDAEDEHHSRGVLRCPKDSRQGIQGGRKEH